MILVPVEQVANPVFKSKLDFVQRMGSAVRTVAPQFGFPATPTDVFVVAHMALSTGWGRHARGWNLNGMKAGVNWPGKAFASPTFEYDADGVRHDIVDNFRAFDSAEDSLRKGYFSILSNPGYAASREKLKAGSLDYMEQLGHDGWYTAPIDVTSNEWKSLVATINGWPNIRDGVTMAGLGGWALGGALVYFSWQWWKKRGRR